MTTGEWKSGGAYHRSLSAAAGTAAAGTAAAIKVAPLGASREGVSGSGSAKPLCSRALQEIHDVEVRTGTRIVENQALITNSVS
jgi:hypothetical protein